MLYCTFCQPSNQKPYQEYTKKRKTKYAFNVISEETIDRIISFYSSNYYLHLEMLNKKETKNIERIMCMLNALLHRYQKCRKRAKLLLIRYFIGQSILIHSVGITMTIIIIIIILPQMAFYTKLNIMQSMATKQEAPLKHSKYMNWIYKYLFE